MRNSESTLLILADRPEFRSFINSFLSKTKPIFFHTADFLRIAAVIEALFSRWLIQFFRELSKYGKEPSVSSQEEWFSFVAIATSVVLTSAAKLTNHLIERYPAVQDYLFSIFTSSFIYFFLDILSEKGKVGAIPLPVFALTTGIAIPIIVGFFFKILIPDSLPYFTSFIHLFFSPFLNVRKSERFLNTIVGLSYGVPALTIFFWCLHRELYDKTAPPKNWQIFLLFLSILVTGRIGYQLTEHPVFFQRYVALSKGMRDGSLNYACISKIFYLIVKENCGATKFCIDKNDTKILKTFCLLYSMVIGIFSLMTTEFQFEKSHKANELLILAGHNAMNKVKNGAHALASFFKKCCRKSGSIEEVENRILSIVP